jgi:hypothetical protein
VDRAFPLRDVEGGSAAPRAMLTHGAEGALFWHRASERSIHQRAALSAFQIECDFGIDAIVDNFDVFHRGGEFFDVNRANVTQCFRGLVDCALRGVFLAFR